MKQAVVLALQVAKGDRERETLPQQSVHFSADVKIILIFAHRNPEYQIHNFVSNISMICFFLHGPQINTLHYHPMKGQESHTFLHI